MTITCISDTHSLHKQLDLTLYPADVLVHAGDFTGSRVHHQSEAIEFLEWFSIQPFQHKLFISGNHDLFPYYKSLEFSRALEQYPSITYLQDSSVTIDTIKFYGSPWTPPFYDWAFMRHEPELRTTYKLIPADTDVLITHGPARGTLDLTASGHLAGSKALAEVITTLSIKAHIFGHIHETSGIQNTSINASCLTEHYKLKNPPKQITI